MENIRSSVDEIKNQIKSLQEQLIDIQSQCKHTTYNVRYTEEGKTVLKICVECDKVLGYPNKEDLEKNDFL
tara:strand:- start:610 stop:822 length:213 start_codon:yes stop_codon:yes gene_type:complete